MASLSHLQALNRGALDIVFGKADR